MQGFGRFLAYRLGRMLVALWAVVTVVFVVMRLSGDPVPLLLPPDAPIAEMERLRHEMGLDRPILVQYGVFVNQALRGDFGRSIHFRTSACLVS
jgi:peptide/nickel transport system permease protein